MRQCGIYPISQIACGNAGFVPRIVAESGDFPAMLAMVAAGIGVSLLPGWRCATFLPAWRSTRWPCP
ncbi:MULTISPECIES: LysR substrate-binding domain-containing protein [unclassified Nocardia]|uniref:LysR substrate-binding domain-containing protein n=1 Tax=unclassified Nocardia TaxID=2637762 RepID=UPI001CE3CC31|nr:MULTISPECIES: LysR substrate-binding domain-containing protein [unclassified Nocardia]